MWLSQYDNHSFDRGASQVKELCWLTISRLFVSSWLPGNKWRVGLLKLFGAKVGAGLVIKPGVRVKFPWRLCIGDHCWIGEDAWIDNLAEIRLGDHVCLSQGVYLCTGSHDWSKKAFDLIVKPIVIESHAWLGAKSIVGPGVIVGEGAVLSLGSVATKSLAPWSIHGGNPATFVKTRKEQN